MLMKGRPDGVQCSSRPVRYGLVLVPCPCRRPCPGSGWLPSCFFGLDRGLAMDALRSSDAARMEIGSLSFLALMIGWRWA